MTRVRTSSDPLGRRSLRRFGVILGPVYRAWMRFGLLLNRVTTPVLLGIVFFLMITPVALIRRLRGKDSMARDFDPNRRSYRVQSQKRPRGHLQRPY